MAIENYKPTLWEDAILKNFHDSSFIENITTPPAEVQGEKVIWNRLSPGVWKNYSTGQKIEWSDVATNRIEMTFPYQKYYAFVVSDCDACQLKDDVLDSVTQEQSDVLGEEISQEVVGFIVSNTPAYNTIGATAANIIGTTSIGAATATEDGKNIVLRVDSGEAKTITLATGDTLDSIVAKINTTVGLNIASDNGGKLNLKSTTFGSASNITVDSTSDAAALSYLGLTSGSSNSGAIESELVNKSNAYDLLVDLNTLANKAKVPTTERYFIIPPDYLALIAKDPRFTLQYTILQNGVVEGATINGTTLICKADNPNDKVVLTHQSSTGYAMQLNESEAVRLQDVFGDGVRGLVRYGYTQLRPESSCVAFVKYE